MIDRAKLLTREHSTRTNSSANSGLVSQKMIDRAKLLTREHSTRTNSSANSGLVSQKMIDRAKLLTRENSTRTNGSANSGLVSQKMIDRAKLLTRENSTRTNSSANSGLVSQKMIDRAKLLTGECGLGDCGRRDLLRRRCLGAVDDQGYCRNTDRRDSEQGQEQNPSLWLVRSDCRTASMPVCGGHDCLPASCGWMTSRRILNRTGCRGVAGGLHPRCMLVRGWLEVDGNEAPVQACSPAAAAGEHSTKRLHRVRNRHTACDVRGSPAQR